MEEVDRLNKCGKEVVEQYGSDESESHSVVSTLWPHEL